MSFKVTIGTFGDDDTAEIKVDDRPVGWLERVHGERFKSASSYARVIGEHDRVVRDVLNAAFEQLKKHDVDSRKDAKLEVEAAFERAWTQLATKGAVL